MLNASLREYYSRKRVSSRIPPLKLTQLYHNGHAHLHGRNIKAAATRALLPWLKELCSQHLASTSQRDVSCNKAVGSLSAIVDVFYSSGFLSAETKASVGSHALRFAHHFGWLAANPCLVRGEAAWHFVPNVQCFQQICGTDCKLINPRSIQRFAPIPTAPKNSTNNSKPKAQR